MNFFDPRWTSDGKPFGQERFKQIVQERYIISRRLHTSYTDTASISPTERSLILQFMKDDMQREQEALEQKMANRSSNRRR